MFELPNKRLDVLDFLGSRRSNLAKLMREPGPNADELEQILTIGARVPDHRKLEPWRFILFEGESRQAIGEELAKMFQSDNPDLPQDRVNFERNRFLRAPLVIAVIYSPVDDPRGTPKWEQQLSSGVVCYNVCLSAQALGYGAQWLIEWYAYDERIHSILGMQKDEKVAGFIYIGTPGEAPAPRKRPNLNEKISTWSPG